MIFYIFSIVMLIVISPLLLSYIKALKMILFYKKPISLLQGYKNFSKLLNKETILSKESSSITTVGPFLVLSPLLLSMFFLPSIVKNAYYVSFVDAFTITGLISLSTFF